MDDVDRSRRREKIEDYIDAHSKSATAGVICALIYGPFGCIYTNPWYTLIGVLLAVGLWLVYWPLIALVWIACVLVVPFQVRAYNARLRRRARYYVV